MPSSDIRPRIWVWVGPTNVAPMLATSEAPEPMERLKQRPPTRPRASSTITDLPGGGDLAGRGEARQPGADDGDVGLVNRRRGLGRMVLGLGLLRLGLGGPRDRDGGPRHERSRHETAAGDGALA